MTHEPDEPEVEEDGFITVHPDLERDKYDDPTPLEILTGERFVETD